MDAREVIEADLRRVQRIKRRHFSIALVAAVALSAAVVLLHARPDLLDQPPAQLVAQGVLFVLCLVVFPAIGVGILFPSTPVRIGLVLVAIAAVLVGTTGWPLPAHGGYHPGLAGLEGCVLVVLGAGGALVALGLFSGAFLQRRRRSSVFWVAAGLAFAALDLVTWMCPEQGLTHVLPAHIGAAVALLVIALVAGAIAHRQALREEPEGDEPPPGDGQGRGP